MYHASCTMYHAECIIYHASCSRCSSLGSRAFSLHSVAGVHSEATLSQLVPRRQRTRKLEFMKYVGSLGVATWKEGTKLWRAMEDVRQDCKTWEVAQQERSRGHAGEPGSASSGVAVRGRVLHGQRGIVA